MPEINIDDFLLLRTGALSKMPPEAQFAVLGELAQRAPGWLRMYRSQLVDRLREELTDAQIAARFGVTTAALATMGDGPIVLGGRTRLLRQAMELAITLDLGDIHREYAVKALELLGSGRPSAQKLKSAATRVRMVVARLGSAQLQNLSQVERDILARAASHAGEILTGSSVGDR